MRTVRRGRHSAHAPRHTAPDTPPAEKEATPPLHECSLQPGQQDRLGGGRGSRISIFGAPKELGGERERLLRSVDHPGMEGSSGPKCRRWWLEGHQQMSASLPHPQPLFTTEKTSAEMKFRPKRAFRSPCGEEVFNSTAMRLSLPPAAPPPHACFTKETHFKALWPGSLG